MPIGGGGGACKPCDVSLESPSDEGGGGALGGGGRGMGGGGIGGIPETGEIEQNMLFLEY